MHNTLDSTCTVQVLVFNRRRLNVKQHNMEEFLRPCCIQGYHIYQEVWTAAVEEELICEREPHSCHDHYAVAEKNGSHHRSFTSKAL